MGGNDEEMALFEEIEDFAIEMLIEFDGNHPLQPTGGSIKREGSGIQFMG
jgi:hypothetical protein